MNSYVKILLSLQFDERVLFVLYTSVGQIAFRSKCCFYSGTSGRALCMKYSLNGVSTVITCVLTFCQLQSKKTVMIIS